MLHKKNIGLAAIVLVVSVCTSCGRFRKSSDSDDANQGGSPLAPPVETAPVPAVTEFEPKNDQNIRLRGYQELSRLIENAMLTNVGTFSLEYYVGGGVISFFGPYGMAPLMGYYNSDPLNPGWRNVSPNTASTSVYLLAVSDFAKDLSRVCLQEGSFDVKAIHVAEPTPALSEHLRTYCRDGMSMKDQDLHKLWQVLTAGLVPDFEFDFWRADLLGVNDAPLPDRVESLVVTAIMSPQVLFH
ncbi:MAG: hypothetical protein NTV34_06885 [Proteobacteria bacterium]|nr:hypothetical protein [Pseudomonadota bacterium]